MTVDLEDENAAWRKCELAWSSWLQSKGMTVFPTGEAVSNTADSRAPLIHVQGKNLRVPDLQTTSEGVSQFWEVKFRSRVDFDPLTGDRVHWMAYESFHDYVAVAGATGSRVWIVLYEAASAGTSGRWLQADINELAKQGKGGKRYGLGGKLVNAWIFPSNLMEVVPGPDLDLRGARVDLVPREYEARPEITDSQTDNSWDGKQSGMPPVEACSADFRLEFDALCRELGLPDLPRYSVMRIGTEGIDLESLLEFLHYGIRVLLITNDEALSFANSIELQAFLECRLFEVSVIDQIPTEVNGTWIVDGIIPEVLREHIQSVLLTADSAGGINAGQYRIIHALAGSDVVVTAGAGTGKTETMSERLIYLLATCGGTEKESANGTLRPFDLRVDDVALVTFSREAARQMRDRISQTIMLRQRLCRKCIFPTLAWLMQLRTAEISTIHSFAKGILRSSGGSIGFGPGLTVARHTLPIRAMLHDALSPHLVSMISTHPKHVPPSHLWENHLETLWERLENNGINMMPSNADRDQFSGVDWGGAGLQQLERSIAETTQGVLATVLKGYRDFCLDSQSVRTSALIPLALEALRRNEGGQARPCRYLFVDEFQDTDSIQMSLLLEVKRLFGTQLFVVGDVKQGIYRFRGAEGNAFSLLEQKTRELGLQAFTEFSLSRNFRSGKTLLDSIHPFFVAWRSANFIPYSDSDRLRPVTWEEDESDPVSFAKVQTDEFANCATRYVLKRHENEPEASIAILCRQNWQALAVKEAIEGAGGYCHLYIGGNFYKSPAVREMELFLRAVATPEDDSALLQLCESRWAAGLLTGVPPYGVDGTGWRTPVDPIMAWRDRLASLNPSGSYHRSDLAQLRQRLVSLRDSLRKIPVIAWIVACIRSFAPENTILPGDMDIAERERYSRCLDHLVSILDSEFLEGPLSLQRLISWLQVQIATNHKEDEPIDERKRFEGEIVALTVHKAKGLEFDHVLLPYTWGNFENANRIGTGMAVLRRSDTKPRVIWRWKATHYSSFSNVAANESSLWQTNWNEMVREEARLLYVALTRAKRSVHVFVPDTSDVKKRPERWLDLLGYGK